MIEWRRALGVIDLRITLMLLLLLSGGCGEKSNGLSVSGQISYQGQPIKEGRIVFRAGRGQPGIRGAIVGGRYEISSDQGLVAGSYRVEVHASEATGRMIPDTDEPGQMRAEIRDLVPSKYNFETELFRNIDASTSDLNFDLE